MSGEINRTRTRPHLVLFHLYKIPRARKSLERESRIMFPSGWGREEQSDCSMSTGFPFGVTEIF